MATIDVQGLAEVQEMLRRLQEDQLPFAMALGLTQLAQRVKTAEVAEMQRVFDRPTPFTLNSLFVKPATKTQQQSRVWLRDFAPKGTPATRYLMPQIEGGKREPKRSEKHLRHRGILRDNEFLVPARTAPLDKYGNISRASIVTMLSNLGAQFDPSQNTTTARHRFFSQRSDGRLIIFRKVRGQAEPFMIGVRSPHYEKRFAFFDVAERTVNAEFEAVFGSAIEQAIRTAR